MRILLCGLNGAGKTTTAGKLAAWFKKRKQHVVLVAGDLARPAAIEQLQILGKQIGVTVLTFPGEKSPEKSSRSWPARKSRGCAPRSPSSTPPAGSMSTTALLGGTRSGRQGMGAAGNAARRRCRHGPDRGQGRAGFPQPRAADRPRPLEIRRRYARRRGAFLPAGHAGADPLSRHRARGSTRWNSFQPERLVGRLLGMGDIVGLVEKAQAEFDAASTRENGARNWPRTRSTSRTSSTRSRW